ncbi:endonuclease/exonuclease/phosphatase family protein [Streptomyces parvulus]|uniref:endonuclease/exonuclease/phosphatase family protein n=1 Tax=Streptomyces parvulus TaxID=146923 RepID=UPI003F4C694B
MSADGATGWWTWRRGRVTAGVAVCTALLLAFHRAVPGGPGSLLESFLPWLGVVVVVLLSLGAARRSALALARAEPGLIALQELVEPARTVYERTLARDYPYRTVRGTVGLWSKHPLSGARPLDIRPRGVTEEWERGLRAVAHTPRGEVAVYVAHLPSVRVGLSGLASSRRDESARLLGDAVAAEPTRRVVLLGDLNGTVHDRALAPLTDELNAARRGLSPSFPAAFPVARIDQVMARAATVESLRTLDATGSDHLPVLARVTWE